MDGSDNNMADNDMAVDGMETQEAIISVAPKMISIARYDPMLHIHGFSKYECYVVRSAMIIWQ